MSERALIVGCGRIAGGYNEEDRTHVLTHIAAYRHLGVEVAGCCDVDAARAESFARKWGVPEWGTDLEALIAKVKPTIVSDCTPPQSRRAVIERAVAAPGVSALVVEKPLACSAADARATADAITHAGCRAVVNYFRGYDPFYRNLADDVSRQAGHDPLLLVTAMYYGPAFTNASHLLERVIDMLGEPSSVTRLAGGNTSPMFSLQFASGALAVFVPAPASDYTPLELDLMFRERRVRVIDSERRVEVFALAPDPLFPSYSTLAPDLTAADGAPSPDAFMAVFQAAVGGDTELASRSLARAVLVTECLERAGAALPSL